MDGHMLQVPRLDNKWGDHAFSKAGPVLWNSLPWNIQTAQSVASFQRKRKTQMFTVNVLIYNYCVWTVF